MTITRTIRSIANEPENVDPNPSAGTDEHMRAVCAAVECAIEMADRGEVERDEVPDIARSIIERIRTRATREARATHTWWRVNETRGDTDTALRSVPDGYTRVRAQTKPERTNSGVTVNRVTVHGRAYVGGSTRAEHHAACTMSPEHLAHALETAPRTVHGHVDAVSITRLTSVAYPDVPKLIGGDVLTWEEFGTWDHVRAASGRKTRTRVPRIVARAGETSDMRPGELLAPSHDERYAWRGHRHMLRPETVRDTRARNARPVDHAFIIPDREHLADALAGLAASIESAPYRATWSHRGTAGTLTVSGSSDRMRISVSGLTPNALKARTPRGLRASLERATA